MELNLNEMEKAAGCGPITGFFDPFKAPGSKNKKPKAGNEQDNH